MLKKRERTAVNNDDALKDDRLASPRERRPLGHRCNLDVIAEEQLNHLLVCAQTMSGPVSNFRALMASARPVQLPSA